MLNIVIALTLTASPAQAPAGQAAAAPTAAETPATPVVGPENFAAWGAFIRPSAAERKFEDIGWRNRFWPAVEEARELGRPLLLWTMNGHPLGTT